MSNIEVDSATATAKDLVASAVLSAQKQMPPLPADNSFESNNSAEKKPAADLEKKGSALTEVATADTMDNRNSSPSSAASANQTAATPPTCSPSARAMQQKKSSSEAAKNTHCSAASNDELVRRLSRAEAQFAKFHRQLIQANQQTEIFKRACMEKDRGLQEREQHIVHLTQQMGRLVGENQHMKTSQKAQQAQSAQLQKTTQQIDETRRRLSQEMEMVRREKSDIVQRRKELEVQCDVLNKKLASGGAQAQKAMDMQVHMQAEMTSQRKELEQLRQELEKATQTIATQAKSKKELQQQMVVLDAKNKTLTLAAQKQAEEAGKEAGNPKEDTKAMKKLQKELQAEKEFIVDLKQRYTKKKEEQFEVKKELFAAQKEIKKLQKEAAAEGKGAGKGGKAAKPDPAAAAELARVQQDNADLQATVKELSAQLESTMHQMTKSLQEKQTHIALLERTEKENVSKMKQVFEDHDQQIFEYKRKMEQVQDSKVEALNDMRKKIQRARTMKEELDANSFSNLGNRMAKMFGVDPRKGNQLSLMVHCFVVAMVIMFAYDLLF